MKIAQRIVSVLSSEHKTTKEIRQAIPDKRTECLAATISNYPELFVRLDRGMVGLRGRDEHLVRNTQLVSTFALYKKIVNVLAHEPLDLQRIYQLLPHIKQVSIRATICLRKDLFIVAGHRKRRIVGRCGRDEWIRERFLPTKKIKVQREKKMSITDMLEIILAESPKTLAQIRAFLPQFPRDSITCKLSLHKRFVREENGIWHLEQ